MSKEERKKHKASDADRVARRLAKKKVKAVMGKADVKAKVGDKPRTRRRSDLKNVAPPKTRRRTRS
jgi:nucleolar protein 12